MDFRFRFQFEKAMQAVAVLLRREVHRSQNAMRLLGLLYLAERESLKETGKPICGSSILATERGPVLQEPHDLVRGRHIRSPEFARHFERRRFDLEMIDDPGLGKLSGFQIATLQEVSDRHANDDAWDVAMHCRTLPEWIRNDPGKSSKAIPLVNVFDALKMSDLMDEIIEDAKESEALDDMIADIRRVAIRKRGRANGAV